MSKKHLLIFVAILTGCQDEPHTPISNKYCVQDCMKYQFKWFHSKGRSWGTGSSSMNGIGQSKIYERVKQNCEEFYKDEICCVQGRNNYTDFQDPHSSWNYGICTKLEQTDNKKVE